MIEFIGTLDGAGLGRIALGTATVVWVVYWFYLVWRSGP